MEVVLYKLLSYIDECMKKEVVATEGVAQELCGANETIFIATVQEAIEQGYVRDVVVIPIFSGLPSVNFNRPTLTLKGSEYLHENETMQKVKKMLGITFRASLEALIASLL